MCTYVVRFLARHASLERCNPWPHVANHPRVSRLRRSQPPFLLWRHSHYDVIRYWAGHGQRYRRTGTLPRL